MNPALLYLTKNRQLTQSTIIEWQLGVCPDWKVIAPEIVKGGNFALAEKCGLVRSSNGSNYDYFHHRITIPIHDSQGQLIGFGGRLLPGQEGAKYFNPPDSPLYDKSKTLFGLHKAIKHFKAHGMACLVEGYFDVIKLHQHGWGNAVATCGTALTEGQAKLLKRFTDTVLIMRDGDKAGLAAIEKDIPILAAQGFAIFVCELPTGEDPDSLFTPDGTITPCENIVRVQNVLANYTDGIEWLATKYLREGMTSAASMATAVSKTVKLLAQITDQTRREFYIKSIAKPKNDFNLKAADIAKPLDRYFKEQQREAEANEETEEDKLPKWVNKEELYRYGFTQLEQHTKTHAPGIYFMEGNLTRVTRFTIKPLYHIYEASNNRRLLEVNNGEAQRVVEMPSNGMTNAAVFEGELINKGHYVTEHTFSRKHFKIIMAWLSEKMPMAYELKTLGWQPEGFFAYSNAVYFDGQLITYDELGMIKIGDTNYMSLGNSKIHKDDRATDNPYENDLYLKHTPAKINFSEWAKLFYQTYAGNAPYGIAFAFLTLFKDLATRISKMPMLYCFGPKGAGKSAMAESITWLFFSGKNGEGDLIKGYNLNPGQGTPFSFFNRVERFRNCPILMNEFDENNIEDWKFGTFKAAYDGEGREVGDGDTGKKRKTKIQKVQGTVIIVGQFLSIKDDGSVLSRSITCQFALDRVSNLSQAQSDGYEQLKAAEQAGLSSILTELLKHRPHVQQNLVKDFATVQQRMVEETRADGHRIEARLISNYSLVLAATKCMNDIGTLVLPYDFETFFSMCKSQVIAHNRMLKENNSINQFWKTISVLFDLGTIQQGRELSVRVVSSVRIKEEGSVKEKTFNSTTPVLMVRMDNVHSLYAKHTRERSGQAAQGLESLLMYLKEQPYYIGLVPAETFTDKRTSCYAFQYDALLEMGIVLERNQHDSEPKPVPAPTSEPKPNNDDLPF